MSSSMAKGLIPSWSLQGAAHVWCCALCNFCRITFWENQDGGLYLVHICSLISLFRMKTGKCKHILLTPFYYNIALWHFNPHRAILGE